MRIGTPVHDMAPTIPKRLSACCGEGLIILMEIIHGTPERNILDPMRSIRPGCVSDIRSDNTMELFGRMSADNKNHVSNIPVFLWIPGNGRGKD